MSGYSVSVSGNVPTNVPINFDTNSGTAVSSGNTIGIIGVGGTTTSGSGNTVTITTVSASMNWNDQIADFSAVVNEGNFCTGPLIVTLPALASQGNTISIICETSDPITIQADANQFIAIGAETTNMGGTAVSTAQGDNLILVYKNSTSTWWAVEADATWSLSQ